MTQKIVSLKNPMSPKNHLPQFQKFSGISLPDPFVHTAKPGIRSAQ
jgi:hypothetical protein